VLEILANNVALENGLSPFTTLDMVDEKFPEVQGGGSLILAWQIRNKRVLVVGGGEASLLNDSLGLPLTFLVGCCGQDSERPQCRCQSHRCVS
jgi:hypothetical protein